MNTKQSKSWHKKWWVWLIIIIVGFAVVGSVTDNKDEISKKVDKASSDIKKTVSDGQADIKKTVEDTKDKVTKTPEEPLPEAQKKFLALIDTASKQYTDAKTDLQRSEIVRSRDSQLCSSTGMAFNGWVGTVLDVGANGEGKAYLEVEVAPSVKLQTWNNAYSDRTDKTLIPSGSALFDRLVKLEKGKKVTISGTFIAADNPCIKTSNLTEAFRAADPDFIVHFTDVTER